LPAANPGGPGWLTQRVTDHTVAVLGTGIMGTGMAHSLLREGLTVRAWNRTRAKADPLAADGATVTDTAAEAVTGADTVLLILFDATSVLDVLAAAAGSAPDAVWLQATTVGVEGAATIAASAARHGLTLLDSPVLGTRAPAEAGNLTVLLSGDAAAAGRAEPVLSAVGARTVRVGAALGDASALKLACNAWVATLTAALGQSLMLTQGLGLDPQLFLDAITGGALDTPYAHAKGKLILADDYPASFAVDSVRKDVNLMLDAATRAGVDRTLLTAVRDAYADTADAGLGDADMAAVATTFRPR
jgi:3-hydroxyisobutyrate dehydrogenase